MHGGPQLDTLDDVTLTPLVRRALNHETATVLDWQWSPIAYDVYLPGRTLGRFTGTAMVDGGAIPWSIVLKRTRPPQGREQASDEGWKRETLAYRSGLLADIPGQLMAARALDVSEDVHGTTWLWLEDVVDRFGGEWPPPMCLGATVMANSSSYACFFLSAPTKHAGWRGDLP
jgi:hypothetical protein